MREELTRHQDQTQPTWCILRHGPISARGSAAVPDPPHSVDSGLGVGPAEADHPDFGSEYRGESTTARAGLCRLDILAGQQQQQQQPGGAARAPSVAFLSGKPARNAATLSAGSGTLGDIVDVRVVCLSPCMPRGRHGEAYLNL